MGRPIDYSIVGEEFGHLTVISLSDKRTSGTKSTYWNCKCSLCGKTKAIQRNNIESGNSNSCGCRRGTARKVAELSGYSLATVSRVTNGKWRGIINENTANKVKAAAKKIGYEPYYNRY